MSQPVIDRAAPRLRVRDVRAAAEWYRDNLNFAVGGYYTSDTGVPDFVVVQQGSVEIQLTLKPEGEDIGAGPAANPGGVYLYVGDAAGLYDELKKRGVPLLYQLEDFSYGMREFALLDRDGHYVGIGQPI